MWAIRSAALCFMCLALLACGPRVKDKAGLQRLADDFLQANQEETIDSMLGLYHLDGSDAITRQLLKPVLQSELGMPIQTIQFEQLSGSPEENIGFEYRGERYGPSLEPKLRMRVVYETEDQFVSLFSVGQRSDGVWRIVSAMRME